MERDEGVAALLRAVARPDLACAGLALEPAKRVNHRVPDVVDAGGIDALGLEVVVRLGAVREEDVREPVGEHAVLLLRHRPVAGAEPRLDVGDADPELGGRERAGQRRVHVAAHDDELGALFEQHALEGDEREAGLLPVRAGPDPEEAVRPREAEVVEDLRRHALVVVLARVDDELAEEATPPARLDDRRHLDEVRASSDCEDDRRHVLPGSQCDAGLGR